MSVALVVIVVALVTGLVLVLIAATASWSIGVRWLVVGAGLLVAGTPFLLLGLFLGGRPEPLETDGTLAVGVREDDGALDIWLGPGCDSVTDLEVILKFSQSSNSLELVLRADDPGVPVESFGLSPAAFPPGMTADEPLPDELDLREHDLLLVTEERGAGVQLAPVLSGSDQRPGEYWFDDRLGWLSLDEAERMADDGALSTVCDDAPEGTHGG